MAGDDLLERYQTERSPHAEALIHRSLGAGEVSCTFDADVAAARDQAFRDGTAPPPPPFPHLEGGLLAGDGDGLAGRLAPQGRVRVEGREGRFDDLVGHGWVLVSAAPVETSLTEGQRSYLDALGVVRALVDASTDVDGTYRRYFAEQGVAALLYRPDFYVYGAAATADDLPALVDGLQAQLPLALPAVAR